MSLNLNPAYCASHWDSYEAGARKAGNVVSRREWRMVREIFVADTDEEAWELSVNGEMGRMMNEYFLPLLKAFGFTDFLKADASTPDDQVDAAYCAEHNWLIGSPQTVAEKIEKVYADTGGFGVLLLFGFDYLEHEPAWKRSLELLAKEVMPKVAHLTGDDRLESEIAALNHRDGGSAPQEPQGPRRGHLDPGQRCRHPGDARPGAEDRAAPGRVVEVVGGDDVELVVVGAAEGAAGHRLGRHRDLADRSPAGVSLATRRPPTWATQRLPSTSTHMPSGMPRSNTARPMWRRFDSEPSAPRRAPTDLCWWSRSGTRCGRRATSRCRW